MQQATDFLEECDSIRAILEPLAEADFDKVTLFNDWTVNDVLQHLHYFNKMADFSLTDPQRFLSEAAAFSKVREEVGGEMVPATDRLLKGLRGAALLAEWQSYYKQMAAHFAAADPKQRVKWYGPDMSARSAISARQMETWAHGQEIFDVLGLERRCTDGLRNIAHMGANTFGWTFINRGEEVPEPMPHVVLTAPSGAVWEYGEALSEERIEGAVEEFCQVVTQTRNIADTGLQVTGPIATRWMAVAQCFAGPPKTPPGPGTRVKQAA